MDEKYSEEEAKILSDFMHKLTDNMKTLDPRISQMVHKNFWDLL